MRYRGCYCFSKTKKVEAFVAPRLINLQTCGLHNIHPGGAFNEGIASSEPIIAKRNIDCG
jgi:hypothetical protein